MAILIDGYNLLHGTDLFGSGRAAGTLESSREALVQFVLSALAPGELAQTTIVFDAKEAPPGLPRVFHREGLTIRYAAEYADADELLIELIEGDNSPRKLLVVTSDHQVQRAARRRKARFIDSRPWYVEARQGALAAAQARHKARPVEFVSSAELAEWERDVAKIQLEETITEEVVADESSQAPKPIPDGELPSEKKTDPAKRRIRAKRRRRSIEEDAKEIDLTNPFPPGYGEDLLADEETP